MPRTRPSIGLDPLVSSFLEPAGEADEQSATVLDAAEQLLRDYGLARWSMDDVADRAGMGRTSVYRRFANRDELVHAVLGRELRRTLAAIDRASRDASTPEDQIAAAADAALAALDGSVVDGLLRSSPATVLPFLTIEAGPLLALATEAIASRIAAFDPSMGRARSVQLGEVAARLGLSFILTRDTKFPVDDRAKLRTALRELLGAVLTSSRD